MLPLQYDSVLISIILITALRLSEYRIVLKLSRFRTSGLLFLGSRSFHNKLGIVAPGTLEQDHANVMIQKAKSSNKNLMLLRTPNWLHSLRFLKNNFQ